ncbi:hypothetical protein JVT61DRAFT_3242 [Boletus reticuloceps]|uniref:Uncharacterized protein n=1 Tax=Boletus reticuloceps TaxID=495285 RepID=A0A8I2YMN3_9AGAM|nr:hypothetical protein JVT61DRAFT_3242 [Boletus reticuloceps]
MLSTPPRPSSKDTLDSQGVTTTTSHIPGDQPQTPTRPNAPEPSPLWTSCLHVVQYPNAASNTLLETVADIKKTRPLRTVMQDSADYWVKASGELFTIRFPAKIDRCGPFAKIGAYFNLPNTGLDIASLKNARAQFELKFLTEEDNECPPEAIKCSNMALEILMHLHQVLGGVHGPSDGNKKPNITAFWRSYGPGSGDYYSAVVLTEPLFQGLPSTEGVVTPKVTRADIGKSTGCLSPSKAKVAASRAHTPARIATNTQDSHTLRISQLPDPQGRYAGLLSAHANLSEAKVIAPDVFDSQGKYLSPADYEARCKDGQYVEVEVLLRITNGNNNNNDSRVYQLVLTQMKLLPYRMYTKEASLKCCKPVAKGKGKRKADSNTEPEGQSPTKKAATTTAETDISDMEL